MTDQGRRDEPGVIRESRDNVPQERVQDNENWGARNRLPEERGEDYWEDVTDQNREPEDEKLDP
ncbi:hypothetical protein [Deinococcus pimensis]|uniref:hypothetical protein n=1 Tax=Deinococcus pimensis TaxID=309888 RepID=UPI0004849291|nr:hypothetical protein [Deinococcus pimensis]